MNTSQSSNLSPAHRGRRRLLLGSAVAVLLLLVAVLVVVLVRGLTPPVNPVLRLAPAAAAVDEQTILRLSGLGWSRGEDVAICVSSASDDLCDEASALTVIQADQQGAIEADVRAGPLLGQGMTTFIASGLDSGQVATRLFRVLKTASGQNGLDVAPSGEGLVSGDTNLAVTTGTPNPQGVASSGASWLGEYFANPDLSGTAALTREDPELVFNWAFEAPDPSLPQDGFSVRWTRRIPFTAGSYRFLAEGDGGLRLIVDDQIVIDQWQDTATLATYAANIELSEGEHEIVVAYLDQQGAASVALRWEAQTAFVDWRGEYFANPDLSGEPALVRNDTAVDFDWGDASPAPELVPADGFSARWTRTLPFAQGPYRFSITANDGARVLVDNQVVIDAWSGPSDQALTADTPLTQGDHQITVLFFDSAGPARVVVGWSPLVTETPAGGVVVSTPSQTPSQPGEPGSSPTPTETLTPSPSSTIVPTQTVSTPTSTITPGPSPTPTSTATPGPSPTPTSTATPGPSPTPTSTVTPGPSPTPTNTITPGPTPTPTPTPTTLATPLRTVGLSEPEGPIDTLVVVRISGQWPANARVEVSLLQFGVPIQPRPQPSQVVSTGASTTTSSNGEPVETQFRIPTHPLLVAPQRIQVVVHTDSWNEWAVEEFYITN